jgi:predicted Holliday junction resolvase-like endonuclease
MIEIFIIFLLLLFLFTLFIYFNTSNKGLSVKILNQEQTKKILEQEIIRLEECIKIKNKKMIESAEFKERLDEENETLKKICTKLESTMDSKIKEAVEEARADSIKRQRSILKGQATEHLAPYINSEYSPKDYKFMGDPIDYIIFDGLGNIKSKEDTVNKIIFMDIKTGKSQLNRAQRAIKKCIQEGNIEFQVYRPEKDIDE